MSECLGECYSPGPRSHTFLLLETQLKKGEGEGVLSEKTFCRSRQVFYFPTKWCTNIIHTCLLWRYTRDCIVRKNMFHAVQQRNKHNSLAKSWVQLVVTSPHWLNASSYANQNNLKTNVLLTKSIALWTYFVLMALCLHLWAGRHCRDTSEIT